MLKDLKFFGEDKEHNVYLDNGASCLALQSAKDTADDFLMHYGSVHRGSGINSERSTTLYEQARETILSLIDGDPDEDAVIFTANTTDAINKFAIMSGFHKAIVSDIEHSSNLLPWLNFCDEVVKLKTEDFVVDSDSLDDLLTKNPDTNCVALTGASNISGYVTDIKRIHDVCQKHGVIFMCDASQYAPHFCPSLKDCDVIAYCGHKMYAPYGAGVLAGKKKYLRNFDCALTGGGNVIYAGNSGIVYKDTPWMHEVGTPNAIGCVAMAKVHQVLYQEIGEESLTKHTAELAAKIDSICDELEDAGYRVYFGRKNPLVENRTPILVLENTLRSNKETTQLLNTPVGEYTRNVFCREGAFCAYSLIEKLKGLEPIPLNGRMIDFEDKGLPEEYSLIRFSGGLINKLSDFDYLKDKLIAINQP